MTNQYLSRAEHYHKTGNYRQKHQKQGCFFLNKHVFYSHGPLQLFREHKEVIENVQINQTLKTYWKV